MAAKRHHSSKSARHHEHEGMEHYERGPVKHHARPHHGASHDGHYEGHNARRHQEMQDAGMIHENHAAIANLPQEVSIKPWPSAGSYLPEGLDDTISGVNRQMGMDDSKRSAHNVPKKV